RVSDILALIGRTNLPLPPPVAASIPEQFELESPRPAPGPLPKGLETSAKREFARPPFRSPENLRLGSPGSRTPSADAMELGSEFRFRYFLWQALLAPLHGSPLGPHKGDRWPWTRTVGKAF